MSPSCRLLHRDVFRAGLAGPRNACPPTHEKKTSSDRRWAGFGRIRSGSVSSISPPHPTPPHQHWFMQDVDRVCCPAIFCLPPIPCWCFCCCGKSTLTFEFFEKFVGLWGGGGKKSKSIPSAGQCTQSFARRWSHCFPALCLAFVSGIHMRDVYKSKCDLLWFGSDTQYRLALRPDRPHAQHDGARIDLPLPSHLNTPPCPPSAASCRATG